MKLEGIAAFVAVVEAGSISQAARRLGLSKSVVSERLVALEQALGAHLVQRTTRKLSLTEDGQAFFDRGRRIIRDTNDAIAECAERRGTLVGLLRISAPMSFGVLHLGRPLASFLAAHPGIELSLDLDDRLVDVAADGFDAVIRHGHIPDRLVIAKHLTTSRRVLVAAPSYFATYGLPRSLDELDGHSAILYTNRDPDWRFVARKGANVVRPHNRVRVNNGAIMRDLALAGLGIALLATFIVHEDVARGALQVIDLGVEAESAELFIAYPKDCRRSAKVRALTKHLQDAFGDPPYWEADLAAAKTPQQGVIIHAAIAGRKASTAPRIPQPDNLRA